MNAAECAELFDEGALYQQRALHLFRLKDWRRAERDTARNFRLLELIEKHAECEEDRIQVERWRSGIAQMNAISRALILLELDQVEQARELACDSIPGIERADESLGQLADTLLGKLDESLAHCLAFRTPGESLFARQGDCWTINYQHQTAHFRTTRGLQCLAHLLRYPGREFHVGELVDQIINDRQVSLRAGTTGAFWQGGGLLDAGPILDAQAKTQYKHRLSDLRQELAEAERFNDADRATRTRNEMNAIADQLASAVGLGGRHRKSSSAAERARSAVTKRIKESIVRIGKVNPALGRHLVARIKTGYFCSYDPHPDRPVVWRF